MIDELENLRTEVREAMDEVTRCTECMHIADYSDAPGIIRAELRRLAGERDELRTAYTSASQSRDYWKECAGRASSDLAALKARIAEAVIGKPIECDFENMTVTLQVDASFSTNGKPFRLVVEK